MLESGGYYKMHLKIMSYNIKDGFYDCLFQNPNPKYQPKRENLAKQIIKKYNPDILVLSEACSFKKNHKVKDVQNYQNIFGKENFPFVGYADMFQDGVFGVAILSKYPMKTKDLSKYGKALIRGNIKLPNNKHLVLDGFHLMPSNKNRTGCNSKEKGNWVYKK